MATSEIPNMDADGTPGLANHSAGDAYLAECHAKVNTFEARVRALKSSKDSEDVLSLAKEVVVNMDQTLQPGDVATCERFSKKFCNTLDRADAVVRYRSQQSGLDRLLSAMLGPCSAASGFTDIASELHVLTAEVRNLQLPRKWSGTNSSTPPIPETLEVTSSRTTSLTTADDFSTRETGESWKGVAPSSVGSPTRRMDTSQDDSIRGGTVGVPGTKRLRRAARQESVSTMTYMPSREAESWTTPSGRVWLQVTRTIFGQDKMVSYDLANDVEQRIEGGKSEGYVTALHLDSRGIVWSGHRSGAVL